MHFDNFKKKLFLVKMCFWKNYLVNVFSMNYYNYKRYFKILKIFTKLCQIFYFSLKMLLQSITKRDSIIRKKKIKVHFWSLCRPVMWFLICLPCHPYFCILYSMNISKNVEIRNSNEKSIPSPSHCRLYENQNKFL